MQSNWLKRPFAEMHHRFAWKIPKTAVHVVLWPRQYRTSKLREHQTIEIVLELQSVETALYHSSQVVQCKRRFQHNRTWRMCLSSNNSKWTITNWRVVRVHITLEWIWTFRWCPISRLPAETCLFTVFLLATRHWANTSTQ